MALWCGLIGCGQVTMAYVARPRRHRRDVNRTDVSIEFQPFEGNGRQDDMSDWVLAKAVASRIINVLRQQLARGAIADGGKF